jgi:hypothetical protein
MTTLDRPSIVGIIGSVTHRTRRLRCSVFKCEPRYRIVRAVHILAHPVMFSHPQLQRLLSAHWHAVRNHSSWSRA